ncbi:MFS transporter [Corallococcus carmarthensis]|uniref:MFS transporter n=1 Tax=Corallococcus carmarthensis TaxID=2316728 RepID=A0A3A8KFX9_9BACT|nr:MFS transporter [Corallococcus carmarthensis]RKH07098.1 MFS transporter [Corallococcus carmarthensis]
MSAHFLRHGRGLRRARLGALLLVLAASLGGVVAVGLREAQRGYAHLQFERLAAQGAVIQGPVEMFLRVGVALEQFTGFHHLARALREADPTLEAVRVLDARGRILFSEPPGEQSALPLPRRVPSPPGQRFEVTEDARAFRVALPLSDRFGVVGRLELVMSRQAVDLRVLQRFQALFTLLGGCLVFQVAFVLGAQRLWMRRPRRWLGLAFSAGFGVMTLATSLALVDLYSDGLQQRTSSLAHSLARRLNEAARLGLTLSHLRGLDTLLEDYQRSNTDLGSLALIADERVLVQAGSGAGAPGHERFKYTIDLELTEGPWSLPVRLEVGAAKGALDDRLWRGCRGFLFLFVACGLLGLLVLRAFAPLPRRETRPRAFEHGAVDRLQPLAFLGAFLDGLPLAFLATSAEALHPGGGAALLFFAFHGASALAHLYSERSIRDLGPGRFLMGALLLSAAPLLLMAWTGDFRLWLLLRCLSGLGHGALAAGNRAYLLAVFHPQQPPAHGSRLALSRCGGLLGGTVLGALLAAHLGPRAAFLCGGLCALAALAYARLWLPPLDARDKSRGPGPFRASLSWLAPPPLPSSTGSPREHLPALLLVGLPSLLVRGGVLCFALPLWLSGQGEDADRIGQLLALHALGALLCHVLPPPRTARTRRLLQGGVLGMGVALLALGMAGALEPVFVLALGLWGLCHALIQACLKRPRSQGPGEGLARERGPPSITPVVGALGQCLGPLAVSALWHLPSEPLQVLGGLGAGVLLLGAAYFWLTRGLPGREARHA